MFGNIIAPDCTGMDNEKDRLKKILLEIGTATTQFIVVGSSMGGRIALLLQQEHPELVAGLVLCAPALHHQPTTNLDLSTLPPTIVIHGSNDDIVPLKSSLPFGERLVTVADDHKLSKSMAEILQAVITIQETING